MLEQGGTTSTRQASEREKGVALLLARCSSSLVRTVQLTSGVIFLPGQAALTAPRTGPRHPQPPGLRAEPPRRRAPPCGTASTPGKCSRTRCRRHLLSAVCARTQAQAQGEHVKINSSMLARAKAAPLLR